MQTSFHIPLDLFQTRWFASLSVVQHAGDWNLKKEYEMIVTYIHDILYV